jgi:serine/threonine-protein kinase
MLSHPNIVHIEDYNVTADGMPYLVLEYLQGESLAQRLRKGPLSIEQAASILRQVGSALAAAHAKGIVHRDLKPQNIFLVPSELEGRSIEIAKVLDFGISKMRDSQTVKTQDSALLGTPQYMAPEQATGQHASVDERTDIFALGAIAYEMLSGQPAFSGASIPEVVFKVVYEQPIQLGQHVPSLPAAIAAAVHRAMAKPAAERFASVAELVEAITGQPLISTRATTPLPPPEVGFATGSRNASSDAFAQTMGSGDHGASPVVPPAPPPEAHVRGSAPTVDSQHPPPSANIALAGTVTAAPNASPPAATKRTGVFAAALGAVAVAVALGFVLTREKKPAQLARVDEPTAVSPAPTAREAESSETRRQPASASATPSATGSTTQPASGSAAPPATGAVETIAPATGERSAAGSAPVSEAKPRDAKVKAPPKEAEQPNDTANDGGDENHAKRLKEAETAMRESRWQRAEQLANSVTTSEDASPRQRSRAFMIHGMVQCLGRNNGATALTDLRRTTVPAMRRKLLGICRQAGFLGNVE